MQRRYLMNALQDSPSKGDQWEQVNRILHSSGFTNSEILRSLLHHLAQRSIEEPGRSIKEYEIGVDALRRGSDFDPRVDSSVRVHSARLRTKLAEYYQGSGAADPIMVSLPKGTYLLSCQYRSTPAPVVPSTVEPLLPTAIREGVSQGRRALLAWLAGGVAIVLLTSIFWKWYYRPVTLPPSIRKFWAAFDSRPHETLAVFSNPRFVGNTAAGLRYAPPGPPTLPQEINDRYTGIGEAMALHQLTRLFDQLGYPLHAKRSLLIAWDEARSRNLIFVGGPEVNDSQMELPRLEQFAFKSIEDEPSRGLGAVENLHPQNGEKRYYFNSGQPYAMDYAVIGLVPALNPGRRALILAGRTTFGTQGAAEFLMDENSVQLLLARLGSLTERVPYFEALIRVKISKGVPIQRELILVKERKP